MNTLNTSPTDEEITDLWFDYVLEDIHGESSVEIVEFVRDVLRRWGNTNQRSNQEG